MTGKPITQAQADWIYSYMGVKPIRSHVTQPPFPIIGLVSLTTWRLKKRLVTLREYYFPHNGGWQTTVSVSFK